MQPLHAFKVQIFPVDDLIVLVCNDQLIENLHVVDLACRQTGKDRDYRLKVKQNMRFDGRLGSPEVRPRKGASDTGRWWSSLVHRPDS